MWRSSAGAGVERAAGDSSGARQRSGKEDEA